jgi:hypothetical protein
MKCTKCGIELSGEDMNNHNLSCAYAINDNDYEDLIPCEICSELISFDDYQRHISGCSNLNRMHLPFRTHNIGALEPESIIQGISQINEDPIARSLFSVFIGELNSQIPPPPPPFQNDNTQLHLDEDGEDDDNLPNLNSNPNQLLHMFESLLSTHLEQISQGGGNMNVLGNIPEPNNYEELLNLENHVVGISDIDSVSQFLVEEIYCPVCSETKMGSRTTSCKHTFCDDCLQEWLKESKKCPICMVDLE